MSADRGARRDKEAMTRGGGEDGRGSGDAGLPALRGRRHRGDDRDGGVADGRGTTNPAGHDRAVATGFRGAGASPARSGTRTRRDPGGDGGDRLLLVAAGHG